MTNEEARKILDSSFVWQKMVDEECEALGMAIKALEQTGWIPIKTRPLTEKEREENPKALFYYDCPLPDDGEEVLVTTFLGDVRMDIFCRDPEDGSYFETYCDEDDVKAWMPLPEPYKEKSEFPEKDVNRQKMEWECEA